VSVRSDEEKLRALMLASLSGENAAYHRLLQALAPILRGYFRRRLRDAEEDVEDLVQETLISIHSRRETYDSARPFTVWAFAVARHKLIDLLRRGRSELSLDGFEDVLSGGDFESATMARMDLETLLAQLPPKQARVIRDTKIEGLSVAEAASNSGLSTADVKVSVHRGLKQLAQLLRRP
jgi:RNA polymerase sigma-70 factor (ECF subfamily)